MLWLILALISWALAFLLVLNPGISKLWPVGLAAVVITLMADITLVRVGAFKFNNAVYYYQGVPLLYIVSNFANGTILARFVPNNGILKPLVTVGLASVFLIVEWVSIQLGYFEYLSWSLWHSLGLNIIGFITVLWVTDLFDMRRQKDILTSSPLLKWIKK